MAKKFAPDEFTIPIEAMILSGEHPGLAGLSQTVQNTYHRLIAFCWRHGRSTIPEAYQQINTLQAALFIKNRYSFISALTQLQHRSLISSDEVITKSSQLLRFTVVGLEDKLPHRVWKSPKIRLEEIRDKNLRAAPVSETPKQDPEKPKRSIRQADQDRDVEDLRAAYAARFPNAPALVESELGEILKGCKLREISPAGLVEAVRQHVQKPMGMIRGYLQGRYPIPESVPSWYSWCIRHNGDMKHISEMLTQRKEVG